MMTWTGEFGPRCEWRWTAAIGSDGEIQTVRCLSLCGDRKLNILSLLTGAMNNDSEEPCLNPKTKPVQQTVPGSGFLFCDERTGSKFRNVAFALKYGHTVCDLAT